MLFNEIIISLSRVRMQLLTTFESDDTGKNRVMKVYDCCRVHEFMFNRVDEYLFKLTDCEDKVRVDGWDGKAYDCDTFDEAWKVIDKILR